MWRDGSWTSDWAVGTATIPSVRFGSLDWVVARSDSTTAAASANPWSSAAPWASSEVGRNLVEEAED